MAKLADAADLKSAGRKAVGVQVPLWAPIPPIVYGMQLPGAAVTDAKARERRQRNH